MDSIFKKRCRRYDSMLNREGVSVVERTRRRVCWLYRDELAEYSYKRDEVPESIV